MAACIIEPPSKKILYFCGYIIFVYIKEKIEDHFDLIYNNVVSEDFELSILYTIGDLFCGIFSYIVKERTKSVKIDIKPKSTNSSKNTNGKISLTDINPLIYNDEERKIKYKSLKRVLFLSIFDILGQSCSMIFCIIYEKNYQKIPYYSVNLSLIFDIIIRFFFNRYILGKEFYPHYNLSITICIISFGILSVSDLFYIINLNKMYHLIYLLLTILKIIFYALENVEGKKGLNYEFLNVFNLLFYKGFTQSIIFIIISIFLIIFKEEHIIFHLFLNINSFKNFILVFCYVILNMISNICLWKIIDIYSIQHLTIIKGGICFIFYINDLIDQELEYQKDEKIYIFFFSDIFGYILLFLATLIHNEIIILNCCNFENKTYKILKKKEKTDLLLSRKTIDSLDENLSQNSEILINIGETQSEENLQYQKTQKSDETLKSNENFLLNHPIKTTSDISEDSIEF
jgi:hypothetical protein